VWLRYAKAIDRFPAPAAEKYQLRRLAKKLHGIEICGGLSSTR